MFTKNSLIIAFLFFGLFLPGCGKSPDSKTDVNQVSDKGHSHEEWWCAEHGVPEEICAQCNTKLAAKFKVDGDWCKEHDRPNSQCFVCHPELEAKFAGQYEAKYGTKPPKPTEGGEQHEEKKN